MSAPSAAVEMEGVDLRLGGVMVLRQVNLTIAQGQFAVLVGPNGGGKTTLLKLVLGLLTPSRGRVRVLGESPRRARRRVGYVPQHLQVDPSFPVTVLDVVLMGRLGRTSPWGGYGRADRGQALAALEHMDMAPLAGRSFGQLSGGQRQRVLIARALVSQPEMLLLDEPSAGMDVVGEHELFDLLDRLHQDITVVLVTHDLGFVSSHFAEAICVNRQVVIHPTRDLGRQAISDLYGQPMRMVQHQHHLPLPGGEHG